jgi:hypothetical protein
MMMILQMCSHKYPSDFLACSRKHLGQAVSCVSLATRIPTARAFPETLLLSRKPRSTPDLRGSSVSARTVHERLAMYATPEAPAREEQP